MSTVENLNKIFLEFCDDLANVVPEFSKALENAKKRIEEKPDTKYYLEYFFRHCLPYANAITSCNSEELLEMNIVHGMKFKEVYSDSLSISSKQALWRYLHTFYLLVQSYPKLDKIAEKYAEHEDIEKIKNSLSNHDTNLNNIMQSSAKFAEEILREQAQKQADGSIPGLTSMFEGMDEKKFEESFLNSNIGNLAKEISSDLDLSDLKNMQNPDDLMKSLLGGGGGEGGIGNIIQKVSTKLQAKLNSGQLNEEALMKEATQMMGMLNPALAQMGMGGLGGGKGGMGGMGDLFSMMGGLMGGGGHKKKHSKKGKK